MASHRSAVGDLPSAESAGRLDSSQYTVPAAANYSIERSSESRIPGARIVTSSITTPTDGESPSVNWDKYDSICCAIEACLHRRGLDLPTDKFRGLSRLLYTKFGDQPTITTDDVSAYLDPLIDDINSNRDSAHGQERQEGIRLFRLFARVLMVAATALILGSMLATTSATGAVVKSASGALFIGVVIDLVVIPLLLKHRR